MSIKDGGITAKKLFSLNIKRLRTRTGDTQLSLSKKAGLTHNFINDLENGKKWVSAETLEKLANALDTDVYQFFMPDRAYDSDIELLVRNFRETALRDLEKLTAPYLQKDS